MADDSSGHEAPTRRDYMKYGGAVIGGGLLAGCAGQSESSATPNQTSTETATATATDTETETSPEEGPYTVEMFPVGEVEFESVPESVTTYSMAWADMVISLGQADKLQTDRLSGPTLFYDRFDIDYDRNWPPLWQDGGMPKEVFYEHDPDAFLIDPNLIQAWDNNWDDSDIEEIESNVAPFFGCMNRRFRNGWQKEMGYSEKAPSMLEAFDKVGTVLDERDRVDAWFDLHESLQTEVQSRLPDDGDTPSIGLINSGSSPEKGEFYVLYLEDDGYEMKPYRDLGLVDDDAFAGFETGQYGKTDYETLLEADPDVIVVHWGITTGTVTWGGDGAFDAQKFREKFVTPMEEHEVGSQLTAVQNGRVIPGPTAEQGPLINAFQTELTARLFYPEEFGEIDFESPLDVPEEDQLFDRQRVRDIINGNI
ncbi:ABC transporter substrate-binding protein (plasmid) [Haloferax larsenii]|uniref:ABC transporter substrate-binding protein n=1 Tax=Haloferax larsenii TaxID=302484 RepID=A0ABY5RIX3_HALLR|nr:ABC transporter substrate-binding protein [Haloferax larsenii]UVE52316.1 ABC transporter substrate-binding protein [Haloferax larsenii]